ncbi:TonB-dependent receptor [Agaribacter marinus]|uniref:TonB-dependent receptor n=1 Tax=Agaribacter marinus TaxID=1431249 RepID=A0AA37WI67_9ALTE|nr:TonB-dependent receptor [Agaribacter marinus]GLR70607.1 TonB-dependent receptor [Agaribacter marinus]
MKNNRFKLNAIAASLLVAGAGLSTSAIAQDNAGANDNVEVINVSGIRGSLASSANIKRESAGVVDAITAEDIGKFPDTNLAESLQRITGVSIDRSNNEGNSVSVRGFGPGFNLVTLNGRQMPTSSVTGPARSFNFREIAAEAVKGVQVYKTGKANVTGGGIGASINIQTAKPFDYGEFKAFASAQGVIDTSVDLGDSITPELSGMVSNVFMDGKFGVLLSASLSERHSGRDRVGTDGWVRNRGNRSQIDTTAINTSNNQEQNFWTPWTAVSERFDSERDRLNAQLVLQAAPTDDIVVTADYTLTRFEETSITNRSAYWFDDPFGTTDENGTLVNIFDPDDELNFWAWQYLEKKENDSFGLNIEWQASESLKFTLDVHDSESKSNPDENDIYEHIANLKNPKFDGLGVDIGANFTGEIPSIFVDDSKIPGSAYDKANLVSDLYQRRGFKMDNGIQQLRLDGIWENLEDGALTSINFGFQSTKVEVDSARRGEFNFVNIPLSGLDVTTRPLGSASDQFPGQENLFPLFLNYSARQFIDIVTAENQLITPNISENGVTEETDSLYVSFDFETEFNQLPVNLNVGVRYEDTDVTSYTVQEGIQSLNYRNVEELQVVFDGVEARQSIGGGYTRILPNFDFSMEVTEDLITRFSYSSTIGKPGLGFLFPGTNLNAPRPEGPFRASQGNPNLLPLTSDNFDIALEWYGENGSTASVTYFRKYVENFIVQSEQLRELSFVDGTPITDPSAASVARDACPDSSTVPNSACLSRPTDPVITWEVNTPINLEDREVDGWEFNAQYFFGETGFGAVANYTLVNVNQDFDPFQTNQAFSLPGLSDSGNLVGFYENDQLQVRLAYNWRDEFIQSAGAEPVIVESYGQWDLSASYDINDTVSVFVDAINLTDETTRRFARFQRQLLDAEQYGPRFNIGVRAKF